MRRSVRTIGWVGLVCCVGAIVAVGAVLLTHPRNERGYLEYVSTFGNYDGQHLSDPPPSGTLVAAGDRACAWLDQQQPALWRSDRSWQVDSLYRRYRHDSSAGDGSLPQSFLPGAWAYLCPGSLYLRMPHDVFDDPGD